MASSNPNFHIREATDADLPNVGRVHVTSFSHMPFEDVFGNTPDQAGISTCAARHKRAWDAHRATTGLSPGIVCVHTDPVSGEETTVAVAEWYFYPTGRPEANAENFLFLIPGEDGEQEITFSGMHGVLNKRAAWSRGRGVGILLYMCADPAWRRRGAATMCVRWGLDKCTEMGIPALLEASEDGRPVYERLGYEVMDEVFVEVNNVKVGFPLMMRWPEGTRPEHKKRLD